MANILRPHLSRRDLIRRGMMTATGIAFSPIGAHALGLYKDSGQLSPATVNQSPYDVVIYGATIAGINAAYVLTRYCGRKVAVLQSDWFGGMVGAGGLVNHDLFYPNHMGGIWWQEYQEMALFNGLQGGAPMAGSWPTKSPPSTTLGNAGWIQPSTTIPSAQTPDGVAALAICQQFFAATGADLFLNASLTTTAGSVLGSVTVVGQKITSISTNAGVFTGKTFIDASYEGDMMYASGTAYTIGRESSAQYSEAHAGVQTASGSLATTGGYSLLDSHGNPLFPLIANPNLSNGTADQAVQDMTFRPILRLISNGATPFTLPVGYDPTQYELVGRTMKGANKTTLATAITMYTVANNKFNFNDGSVDMGTAYHNIAWTPISYGDGTPTQRQAIYTKIKTYIQGLLYFLANDPRAGTTLNTNASLYGYANDEFTSTGNFPPQIYIREGRRMVGDTVYTEANTPAGTTSTSTVCQMTYVLDSHTPLAYVVDSTHYVLDGAYFITSGIGPSAIPMTNLIPVVGGITNLIIPIHHSASHVGWMPVRMEPTFAMCGEAAGLMAHLVIANSYASQSINYTTDLLPLLKAIGAGLI